MKNFAIIGVGGYIAPRHIEAIHETGNRLIMATDIHDSVGILDRYNQDVAFFTDFEEFEKQFNALKGTDKQIDYVSICSPNQFHQEHIKFALKNDCHVICEKPLVLREKDIDELKEFEFKYGKKVNTVLQLRVHESILALKKVIEANEDTKYDIKVHYITSRGPWYHQSWKGNSEISGGLATNIGIHFFDMLTWLFGPANEINTSESNKLLSKGELKLQNANVEWMLSIDRKNLPQSAIDKNMTTYRSITINGKEIEFSGGFADLHAKVYKDILEGSGYGLDDAREAIRIVENIRLNS